MVPISKNNDDRTKHHTIKTKTKEKWIADTSNVFSISSIHTGAWNIKDFANCVRQRDKRDLEKSREKAEMIIHPK